MDLPPPTEHPLALARSFLFVPGDRLDRLPRALAAGPDAVIVDLEDAVSPLNKSKARAMLAEAFARLAAPDRQRILVRVNAAATSWHADDRDLVKGLAVDGLGGAMLAKAESHDDLAALGGVIGAGGLVPLIESAKGMYALDAICRVARVVRVAFGHLDFQVDLGMVCGPDEQELVPVRSALVLASRNAGIASPIDGVTVDWQDAERLERDAIRARRAGFGAKLCIHPDQVPIMARSLGPTTAELEWATRVLAAWQASDGGVVSLDGRMVDAPVVQLAQRLIALGRAHVEVSPNLGKRTQ